MSDHDLLRQYAHDGSQAAFATLVDRHLNLVYSAALRQVRSPQLAEEVAQSVFVDLARNAARLKPSTPLVAWLHVVSRRTAVDVVRRESRRQAREHQAAKFALGEQTESADMKTSPSAWTGVEPLLDEAVEALNPTDRSAILLRFFENKSLREVGAALGTSDDAAQKRVSRAVEQLRKFFLRRGISVTAAGLATDLSAHALQSAPAGLSAMISTIASLSGTAASAASVEATKAIAMTAIQKSLAIAAFVAVGGAGLYVSVLAARQSNDLVALREQTGRTAAEIRALQTARASAINRLKAVEQQIDVRLAQARTVDQGDAELVAQMSSWLTRMDRIKQVLAQRPELNIPELQYLKEESWFIIAGGKPLDSDEDVRRVTSRLRNAAENIFSSRLATGLKAYVTTHDGILPASPLELAPYLNPPIDRAILDRYEMLRTGKYAGLSGVERGQIMAPKSPPDPEFDSYSYISPDGHGNTAVVAVNLMGAWQAFVTANPGQRPTSAAQLKPFLKWPMSDEAVQKNLEQISGYMP